MPDLKARVNKEKSERIPARGDAENGMSRGWEQDLLRVPKPRQGLLYGSHSHGSPVDKCYYFSLYRRGNKRLQGTREYARSPSDKWQRWVPKFSPSPSHCLLLWPCSLLLTKDTTKHQPDQSIKSTKNLKFTGMDRKNQAGGWEPQAPRGGAFLYPTVGMRILEVTTFIMVKMKRFSITKIMEGYYINFGW